MGKAVPEQCIPVQWLAFCLYRVSVTPVQHSV